MRSRSFQRGQAIILVAVMLGIVVGMAALAIDGSRAYALRRDMQNAVDYGALAAADSYQRTGSFTSAESAAATAFGVQMRLYSGTSCTAYGSPGPNVYNVSCTYSDGTTLAIAVSLRSAQGTQFSLTAGKTLSLQFARILTNGTSPTISSSANARVGNLLYSPTLAALTQAGCGGASGTAISIGGTGTLKVTGDIVSDGAIAVSSGSGTVAGDAYARCQSSVSGLSVLCYPSGALPSCSYPDVAGAYRTGYHFVDPGYPTPGPIGAGQGVPGSNVNLVAGVFSGLILLPGGRCWFLGGGVYEFAAGYISLGSIVSNELKPPDEPSLSDITEVSSSQFWNSGGANCAGSVEYSPVSCNGHGHGGGNCSGPVPQGDWSFEVTSTRTDTYNGVSYQRESDPSSCQTVHVGFNQGVTVTVSNVPGATGYNIYASMPGSGCAGPFGLTENLPVSGSVLNSNTNPCPSFNGNGCSLGHELITLDSTDLSPPFAPNGGAAPGAPGAYPPNGETAPIAPGHPNQNPVRGPGAAGDRANENNCESAAGAFVTCPGAVTPGAVAIYFPGASCILTANSSDTFLFSGYQYNWISVYEPASNACLNFYGASSNSALIGLIYTPGASFSVISPETFDGPASGGLIANTISFSGAMPAIAFNPAYAPVPFGARLVS